MRELTTQLSFSFRSLLRQRGILLTALLLTAPGAALLVSANRSADFGETWLGLLHLQMLLLILLTPILLSSIWDGRLRSFETRTILYRLRRPETYFWARPLVVWLVLGGSVTIFDSAFWLLSARGTDPALWAGAIWQILLTTGFLAALAGFFSILLRRTIYGLLPLLMYLFASLAFVDRPMFALWFSPNVTERIATEPGLILERSVLLIWIAILAAVGGRWFRERAARPC